jgi:PAS domain S-box-containing protein
MFLVSDTNLTLAFAIAAGVALLLAVSALILLGRTAGSRRKLVDRLSQIERGADHTERRMFSILNSIPVALVETDTSGRFVFANKAAHALLGRKDAELIGLRFHSATWGITYPDGKLIPPDLLPAARALRGQTVKGFTHLIINPNTRKRIQVSVTAMPVTNDLGEIIGSTAAMVETEELAEPQAEATAPILPWTELTGEVLVALDAEGKARAISRGGARLLGCEPAEIEGRDWIESFLPEAERAAAREAFQALIEGRAEPGVDGEGSVLAADGSVRRIAWRSDVVRDDQGQVAAVLAAGREVAEAPAEASQDAALEAPLAAAPAQDPRFTSFAEASEDAVWTADAESGRLTYVSPGFTRLYGFSLAELGDDVAPWMAKVHADDRAALQSAWEGALAGRTGEVAFRFQREGEDAAHTIRDRLFPIWDSERRVVGVGGAARDVSAEPAHEADAGEPQALMRGLFDASNLCMGVLESLGDDVRYAAANGETDRLYGRPVAGATARELGHSPEEIAGLLAFIEGAETSGETKVLEHAFAVGGRDAGWRLGAYAPMPRSGEGRARASFVAVDVTERRKGEASLRDSEARFRALTEAAPQLVWSATATGWCDYLSPQWIEHTGVPADRHYGLGWQEAIHPDDRARVAAAWTAGVAEASDYDIDYRLRGADGAYRWFRARSRAQRDDAGHVVHWFGVSTDVTEIVEAKAQLEQRVAERTGELDRSLEERRKTEAALTQAQRLETVGRLTGGVAHDFNNLLTVMVGALDIIERHADKPERVRRLSEAALTAGRKGERLTRQLMAFSRRQEFQLEMAELPSLIDGCEPLLRRALGEAVPFGIQAGEDLGAVQLDPVQFEAALLNLIINAKDAVETGGSVTLRAERVRVNSGQLPDLEPGDYVSVSVIDTGVGMAPEVAARALEPFFTTKEIGKGAGLGLAQVYGFARQSGGQVQIESTPGAGTSVSIFLPVASAAAEPATAPETPQEALQEMLQETLQETRLEALEEAPEPRALEAGKTVLLVEDDEGMRQVTESLLTELGCSVVTADDGPEALRLLEHAPQVDLLLTDMVMPGGMSGVELAQTARQTRPDLKVLFSTGYAGEPLDEAANQGWSVLRKTYQAEELSQAVKQALAS